VDLLLALLHLGDHVLERNYIPRQYVLAGAGEPAPGAAHWAWPEPRQTEAGRLTEVQ